MIFVQPTTIQAARAGNMVYAFLEFREQIEHETLEPVSLALNISLSFTAIIPSKCIYTLPFKANLDCQTFHIEVILTRSTQCRDIDYWIIICASYK